MCSYCVLCLTLKLYVLQFTLELTSVFCEASRACEYVDVSSILALIIIHGRIGMLETANLNYRL